MLISTLALYNIYFEAFRGRYIIVNSILINDMAFILFVQTDES